MRSGWQVRRFSDGAGGRGLLWALVLALAPTAACRPGGGGAGEAVPDSFKIYERVSGVKPSPRGFPIHRPLAADEPRAVVLQKQLGEGFGAEIIRTHYLAKQLIRDLRASGRSFSPVARARAAQPTSLVLADAGKAPQDGTGRGLALAGFFGKSHEHADAIWIELDADPGRDGALVQTIAGKLGRHIAELVAGAGAFGDGSPPPPSLVDGYALAMEVIAREWRHGDGPAGRLLPDAGTAAQKQRFAAVRANLYTLGDPPGALRPARALMADPGVAATVLYQMAQSKSIGSRIAPGDFYASYATDRIPKGVSPAAVLGVFRNFQAKLLGAWGAAVLAGKPPRDIADLVSMYGEAFPAERSEIDRLFVTVTMGATVKAGGVTGTPPEAVAAELTALAAEVTLGKRTLRDAEKNAIPAPPP